LAAAADRARTLYVSGEESPQQVKMRGERLGIDPERLFVLGETRLEEILAAARELAPRALVVDSIQTVYTGALSAAPGSVSQLRESAAQLMAFAKQTHVPTFLIGHVTKEGAIAGPRVLEHIVDTVLYFEGDAGHPYRVLRAVKNRFGSTNEIGVFEMKATGLEEVANPSELFLADRATTRPVAGSVVVASIEGTRPILVELQALVSPTSFGMPRRVAIGTDPNRLALLLAVLEKRAGLQVGTHDVFVNVVGGLTIDEPAVDLSLLAAVASGLRDRPLDAATVVFGEVGLGGEARPVHQAEARLREAAKMGFKRAVIPQRNLAPFATGAPLELVGVETLRDALEALLR
jgi:DNA repair protein RadA/Sms